MRNIYNSGCAVWITVFIHGTNEDPLFKYSYEIVLNEHLVQFYSFLYNFIHYFYLVQFYNFCIKFTIVQSNFEHLTHKRKQMKYKHTYTHKKDQLKKFLHRRLF